MEQDTEKRYVLGFMFDESRANVLLIVKQKPAWQKGYINGIGGSIEVGETSHRAMVREFKEKTGLETQVTDWDLYATFSGKDYSCDVYRAFDNRVTLATSMTDEGVYLHNLDHEFEEGSPLNNIEWMIAMALDKQIYHAQIDY